MIVQLVFLNLVLQRLRKTVLGLFTITAKCNKCKVLNGNRFEQGKLRINNQRRRAGILDVKVMPKQKNISSLFEKISITEEDEGTRHQRYCKHSLSQTS